MSEGLGEVKLRNVGEYAKKNIRLGSLPGYLVQLGEAYRAKYVTIRNARMTPFFHMAGVCMLLNYLIDYKFHLKYEKMRKYH